MRRALLGAAGATALVGLVALGLLNDSTLRAQAPQTGAANPAFEVASVRSNTSGPGPSRLLFQPGGRLTASNVTLRLLIGSAYGTPQPRPSARMVGGPSWLDADRFDIVAKADSDPRAESQGPPVQMFLMLRTLLAERFKLVVHNEDRELPIYALILARGDRRTGPQLRPSTVDCAPMFGARGSAPPPVPPRPGERPPCGMRMMVGNLAGGAITMPQLATLLTQVANRVVLDKTGLAGQFDIDLTWTPDQIPPQPAGGDPPLVNGIAIDPNGPSIFTALQEQLGLKLDATKGPVDVLVIDRAEHPTEN